MAAFVNDFGAASKSYKRRISHDCARNGKDEDREPKCWVASVTTSQPGAWLYFHKILETGGNITGHLTLMEQPDRVAEPTVAWWKYILNGDTKARDMFVGDNCGLCNQADDFEFGQKELN